MNVSGLFALVFVLFAATVADAHRLDEYLQASRVAVSMDAVTIELDLTPGASMARTIVERVDRSGDGAVSPLEAEAYARAVIADLDLSVNGQDAPLTLTSVEAPPIGEMLDGVGTIRLTMRADLALTTSRRTIRFSNRHAAGESVYLVNALKPGDRTIVLERQSRDVQQRTIDLEYTVTAGRVGALGWSVLGLSLVLGLVRLRA